MADDLRTCATGCCNLIGDESVSQEKYANPEATECFTGATLELVLTPQSSYRSESAACVGQSAASP